MQGFITGRVGGKKCVWSTLTVPTFALFILTKVGCTLASGRWKYVPSGVGVFLQNEAKQIEGDLASAPMRPLNPFLCDAWTPASVTFEPWSMRPLNLSHQVGLEELEDHGEELVDESVTLILHGSCLITHLLHQHLGFILEGKGHMTITWRSHDAPSYHTPFPNNHFQS